MPMAARPTLRAAGLLLSIFALAGGCEDRVPPEARGRDVVRPALGFAVNVPQGWNFRDLAGDVALEIYPQPAPAAAAGESAARPVAETPAGATEPPLPRARPLLAAVHVSVIDRGEGGLDDWADQAVGESKELQPDLEVVKREPGRLADGREALVLVLQNPRGLEPTVQRMLLVMARHRAYAVVATAPQSALPAVEPAFKKCFDSFVVW